jgi:hypothetical protein
VLIIVTAGMVAGTTNLVAAGAIFGGTMTHGFQMIASGVLGEQAFSGGLNAAVLGAGLHFAISIAAAALYLWAALRHHALTRHWLVGGVLFGVLAYLVMNVVVVPLSNAAGPELFTEHDRQRASSSYRPVRCADRGDRESVCAERLGYGTRD